MSKDVETPASKKPAAKRKLGRGLGALLGEAQREEPLVRANPAERRRDVAGSTGESSNPDRALQTIAVAAIEPHPGQPRRHFAEDALEELAASIATRGVIQPVIVRPLAANRYQLVAGERRWRAAQKARLHEIPALVRDLEETDVLALALIENVQREDLNPVEEAQAYQRLADDQGMTQAEIARLVDKSRSHVANLQRLLALPDGVLDHVISGALSMGHARALIGHDNAEGLAEKAIAEGLTVREVERLARGGSPAKSRRSVKPSPGTGESDADIAAMERHLEEFLGLPIRIIADADPRSGTVSIKYRTLDQLDLICQRLTGGEI
ncbi:MAG: chromosome partitioning protein ParB [Sandaracinus sp.]|nr:chromosome partitioning protein ParB [Sandaracinus sp.]